MNKCREEFENWETSNGGAGYDYEVWQAAWNARQPEVVPASSVLVPTIDELAEAMYQNNTALLTNVEARYIAKVVHALLTKGRGGV